MNKLNKWQKYYIEKNCNGKTPRNDVGKLELELLGFLEDIIEVTFRNGETEMYNIVFENGDMNEGDIDVITLASNMRLWYSRDLEMKTGTYV